MIGAAASTIKLLYTMVVGLGAMAGLDWGCCRAAISDGADRDGRKKFILILAFASIVIGWNPARIRGRSGRDLRRVIDSVGQTSCPTWCGRC